MSGGEKTRLLLALATRNAPHLLLLDEPTNHLDMDARASLVDAINDFEGAVVLVSHDTHLVKMVADQLWVVADGTVKPFEGDIDDYQAKLLRERNGRPGKRRRPRRPTRKKKAKPAPRRGRGGGRQAQARHLKRAIEKAEKELADLNKQRGEVEAKLADPGDLCRPAGSVAPICRSEKSGWNARSPTPSTTGWWPRKPSKQPLECLLRGAEISRASSWPGGSTARARR